MCGLIGAFGPRAMEAGSRIEAALDAIGHRGPDDRGFVRDPERHILIGHVRLSILGDARSGRQPMRDSRGGWLAFNGEVYNHLQLRGRVVRRREWQGSSDTETLLALLEERGAEGLAECRGMYAGAWFDAGREQLVLFRDPLAIKPLFIRRSACGTIYFGSEPRALHVLEAAGPPSIDGWAMSALLRYQNLPPGRSLLAGLQPLRPGAALRIGRDGSMSTIRDPRSSCTPCRGPEASRVPLAAEEVRTLVEESVRSHLLSERAVGVHLSGGVDSTIVAAIAARDGRVRDAFIGAFHPGGADLDERPIARATASRLGLELHEVEIRPEDFADSFSTLIRHLGEPRMGTGSLGQFIVARAASRVVPVILSGLGGDELFGGYPLHQAALAVDGGHRIDAVRRTGRGRRSVTAWMLWRHALTGRLPLAPHLLDSAVPAEIAARFEASRSNGPVPLEVDAYYREVYVPGLLEVEDRVSMAHGLETRIPLWSPALVGRVMSRPSRERFGGGPKWAFRQAFREVLTPTVANAPKRGFPTPFAAWFRGPLREFVISRLDPWPSLLGSFVAPELVASTVDGHLRRPLPGPFDERRANRIWLLLSIAEWFDQWRPSSIHWSEPTDRVA